jgi:CRISPR-associated protein Cas6
LIAAAQQPSSLTDQCPCVKVSFALIGKQLPADHGYLVYSAISRSTPSLHGVDWLAVELISGFPSGRGLIALPDRGASLHLRIPADHYRDVLALAGKRLEIGGHQIRLSLPVARPFEPAPSLYARVVTIKKFTEADPFIDAVKRKLDSFGIQGRVELPRDEQGRYRRRIVTIHGRSVVGFSVAVHDLSDEGSRLLQAGAVKVVSHEDGTAEWQSIFSRRAMGCGIFSPATKESAVKSRDKSLINWRTA